MVSTKTPFKKFQEKKLGCCCCRTCSGRACTWEKLDLKKIETGKKPKKRLKELLSTTQMRHLCGGKQLFQSFFLRCCGSKISNISNISKARVATTTTTETTTATLGVKFGWATRYKLSKCSFIHIIIYLFPYTKKI